eukprot:scaffold29935_cov63-Phaeocystis_antarctica.AAC.2
MTLACQDSPPIRAGCSRPSASPAGRGCTQPSAPPGLVGSNISGARLQIFAFQVVDVLLRALQLLLECGLLLLKF